MAGKSQPKLKACCLSVFLNNALAQLDHRFMILTTWYMRKQHLESVMLNCDHVKSVFPVYLCNDVFNKALHTLSWLFFFLTSFKTLRPRQNGWHFADNSFKPILLNEKCFILIKISLKCVPRIQLTISQHWVLDNNLGPNRQQAVIWTNDSLALWFM